MVLNMKRLGGLIVCFFLVAGLNSAMARQTLDEVRDKWFGRHVDELVEAHGYPDKTMRAPNGNKVHVFVKNIKQFYPVPIYRPAREQEVEIYTPKTGTYHHGYTRTKDSLAFEHKIKMTKCAGYFEVNPRKIIVDVHFKGENCPTNGSGQ